MAGTNASPKRLAASFQLTGLGDPLLTYQVLACTNLASPDWTNVGTVTANTGGTLQFPHATPMNSPQRFYRLAR